MHIYTYTYIYVYIYIYIHVFLRAEPERNQEPKTRSPCFDARRGRDGHSNLLSNNILKEPTGKGSEHLSMGK